MSGTGKTLYIKSVLVGLIAGLITTGAGLGGLNWAARINSLQVLWIVVAGLASVAYTALIALGSARTDRKIDHVDVTVTDMAAGDKNKAVALLAKVFSLHTAELVGVLGDPARLPMFIDTSLATLHYTICQCRGIDEDKLRVFLISGLALVSFNGQTADVAGDSLVIQAYPHHRRPTIELNDPTREQLYAVMSRRYPYLNGWLRSKEDGSPRRGEYDVLPPGEIEITSYIRVGIPQFGVLCVDSSDDSVLLSIADRELAAAFADILTSPPMTKIIPVALHPASPSSR